MMIGFRYRQQLPLIRLYSVLRVQALGKNLVSLEPVATCDCRQALLQKLYAFVLCNRFFIDKVPVMEHSNS